MRGSDRRSGELFSYVDLEQRVRPDHPLRAIRSVVNEALDALSGEFASLYSGMGRPSIAPEMLLRAMLLQAFYSIRSERQLMERMEYDLLFRWFVGLGVDDAVWDHSTFSKNRDRLLAGDIAAGFLLAILAQPRGHRLLSSEHFSVDGTLIEAWASMKSFRPRDDRDPPSGGGRAGGPSRGAAVQRHTPEHDRSRCDALSCRWAARSRVMRRATLVCTQPGGCPPSVLKRLTCLASAAPPLGGDLRQVEPAGAERPLILGHRLGCRSPSARLKELVGCGNVRRAYLQLAVAREKARHRLVVVAHLP